jgi:hypothetical protein
MNINQINNKQIIKGLLIIIVIAVFALVIHKYLQFRTVKMEKLRVEQLAKLETERIVAEQKAYNEKIHRCNTAKSISEISYINNLLSVNLDCVDTEYVLKEISKKIGVKIIYPDLVSIRIPISFNNLTTKDGLDILAKNIGFSTVYKPSYRSDKNIWSFDEVILEVKDPPQGGVVAIVETKDSFDFVRADGTNKRSYEILDFSQIKKSSNDKFVVINKYYSRGNEEFIVLNNQGDIQWKFKISDAELSLRYSVSNNGKYIVAIEEGECDPSICNYGSYIVTEKGIKKTTESSSVQSAVFSHDGNFFIGNKYEGNVVDVFDSQGNKIYSKKTMEEVKNLVPGFDNVN